MDSDLSLQLDVQIYLETVFLCIIGFMFFISLISVCGFWLTIRLWWGIIPLALLLTFGMLSLILKYEFKDHLRRHFLITIACFTGCCILSYLVAISFYDISWDGQTYHIETIIRLAQGWNPLFETSESMPYRISINHWAKGSEIQQAALYVFMNRVESGKMFNFLLAIASFLIATATLLQTRKVKPIIATLFGLSAALNTVVICQLFTYYVDGQLGSLLLILLLTSALIYREGRLRYWVAWALTIIVTVNVKVTGLPYAGVFWMGLMAAFLISKKRVPLKRVAALGALSVLIGVAFIGYNPYVKNTLKHGHPFFPIVEESINHLIALDTPSDFLKMGTGEKLLRSIFSRSSNHCSAWTNERSELKIPFTMKREEVNIWTASDVRVGGFGPLFSGMIFLAILVTFSLMVIGFKEQRLFMVALGTIFISVIINPHAWWARYVPQLWLLPMIALLGGFSNPSRIFRFLSLMLLGVTIVNIVIVSLTQISNSVFVTRNMDELFAELKTHPHRVLLYSGPFGSHRIRLREKGIEYLEIPREKMEKLITFEHKIELPGSYGESYILIDPTYLY
jgi:hypothetical protein